jgi:hypothetical protein
MKRSSDADLSHIWDQAEVLPDEEKLEADRIEELGKLADNATLFTETLKRKLHVGILDAIDELLHVVRHSNHTAPKVTACRTLLSLAKECGVLDLNPITNFLNAVNDELDNDLRRED